MDPLILHWHALAEAGADVARQVVRASDGTAPRRHFPSCSNVWFKIGYARQSL